AAVEARDDFPLALLSRTVIARRRAIGAPPLRGRVTERPTAKDAECCHSLSPVSAPAAPAAISLVLTDRRDKALPTMHAFAGLKAGSAGDAVARNRAMDSFLAMRPREPLPANGAHRMDAAMRHFTPVAS